MNAIEMIRSKNIELSARVEEYAPLMKSNASRLSMVLNGVIDANVNGGIANYQSVCCVDFMFYFSYFQKFDVGVTIFLCINIMSRTRKPKDKTLFKVHYQDE